LCEVDLKLVLKVGSDGLSIRDA